MPVAAERTLNKKLSQIFRMRGLALRPDAMQPLYDVLQGDEGWQETLQTLLVEVQNQELKGGHVDADTVRTAIRSLRQRVSAKPVLSLECIDAFSMPRARFDKQRKTLVPDPAAPSLHASAPAKSAMHALRLAMVEQRVRRHHMFKPPPIKNGIAPKEHLELISLDSLLGRSGTHVVLGVLSELEEGTFALEDAHASIPLDLSQADVMPGLFTRQAIVLAEGEVDDNGNFVVRQLGLPPAEPRQTSLASLGSFDLLHQPVHAATSASSSPATSSKPRARPAAAAAANTHGNSRAEALAAQNAMLVVLSDVWLDSPSVLARLTTLFEGYEQVGAGMIGAGRTAVPLASFFTFVLCGNFSSSGLAAAHGAPALHGAALTANFKALAAMLHKCPALAQHAHFVLVPGPDDPCVGAADVLPRAPLPRFMTSHLRNTISHLELMSSPCRLLLCGQEVVILREELLVKARRACVLRPLTSDRQPHSQSQDGGTSELNQHLIKSVIHGAHLCPLPQSEAAVYWQLDHSLWLHPSPDVLVIADRQAQFQHEYEGTLAFNPGGFASDLSWMVYRPAAKEAEASSFEA